MADFNIILRRLAELYVSRWDKYVAMHPKKKPFTPKYRNGYARLDYRALYSHLAGKYAVCVFAGEAGSRFFTFDVDIDDRALVRRVMDGLVDYGFPAENIYVNLSGGKGYHVEVFFDKDIPVERLKEIYMVVTERGGIGRKTVEFRPTDRQGIKLPLGVHRETLKTGWFLDQNTFEPICGEEGYQYLFKIERLPAVFVENLIEAHEAEYNNLFPPRPAHKPKVSYDGVVGDSLPVLKEQGTRHNTMVEAAVYLYAHGFDEECIYDELMSWVSKQDQDLISSSWSEVEADAKEITAWVMKKGYRHVEPFLLRGDLEACLRQPTRLRRKIAFLIATFTRKYGQIKMPGERIGEYVGVTPNYAITMIKEMSKKKLVVINGGKRRCKDRAFACEANTYKWIGGEKPDGDVIRFDWDFKAPTFSEAWCSVITSNVSPDRWKKIFTAKELDELNNYLEEHKDV